MQLLNRLLTIAARDSVWPLVGWSVAKVRQRFAVYFIGSVLMLVGIVWGAVALASGQRPTPDPIAQSPQVSHGPQGTQGPQGSATASPADVDPTAALTRIEAGSPSGKAVPLGNLPGWHQVFSDDFTEGSVPMGSFPGDAFAAKWSANYFDGTPDTAGQHNGGRSGYYPSKVLSIHDGVLDMYLHSENGVSMGAAPAPKIGGTNEAHYNSQIYGLYSVRFRSDALPGFKVAWLLWPDSGKWPADGEIDFPEQDLASKFFAAMHSTGSTQESASATFQTDASFQAWNTATIEWAPGRVEFFLNGKSIGVSTSGVPSTPMHYVLQTESCLPTCPDPKTQGHLYLDWVAIWARG